jgi:hypothetical protein
VSAKGICGALSALEATGLSHWDALLELVDNGVPVRDIPYLDRIPEDVIRRFDSVDEAVIAITDLAKTEKVGANAALNAYLSGRKVQSLYLRGMWVKSLPEGLGVSGKLEVAFTSITTLPSGIRIGGHLNLEGSDIRSLPEGLALGGGLNLHRTLIRTLPLGLRVGLEPMLRMLAKLDLRECPEWDGHIPEDAEILGMVVTDMHPRGITLKDWRTAHPYGERWTTSPPRVKRP